MPTNRIRWYAFLMLLPVLGLIGLASVHGCIPPTTPPADDDSDDQVGRDLVGRPIVQMLADGQRIFRFDTFGSEAFWGGVLKLHQAVAGQANAGVGPGLSPNMALNLGLKVDSDLLLPTVIEALQRGTFNLDDPATTLDLLKANAVVGVTGFFDDQERLTGIGIQCALCHSTVDNAIMEGIGRRLDGWANRDLDIGKIILLAPELQPLAAALQTDIATVQAVLNAWGPGKFDAQLALDGKGFRPDGRSAATLLPPAFGLAGVNNHTWTGSWGTVTYWNAFVANIEMHGQGTFYDPRLNDPVKYPLAVANRLWDIRNTPDQVTPKLPALHVYQLSIPAPVPGPDRFDAQAAQRGAALFAAGGKANCARCHVPPVYTEPGWNLHTAAEIGIDDFQSSRSPDGMYRTAPLRGLWTHMQGGFYHDGRFGTLLDVVNHYNTFFGLGLSETEKSDVVEFLKSL